MHLMVLRCFLEEIVISLERSALGGIGEIVSEPEKSHISGYATTDTLQLFGSP